MNTLSLQNENNCRILRTCKVRACLVKAIFNGRDPSKRCQASPEIRDSESFTEFKQRMKTYKRQLMHVTRISH